MIAVAKVTRTAKSFDPKTLELRKPEPELVGHIAVRHFRTTPTEVLRRMAMRDEQRMNDGQGPDEMQRRYARTLDMRELAARQAVTA